MLRKYLLLKSHKADLLTRSIFRSLVQSLVNPFGSTLTLTGRQCGQRVGEGARESWAEQWLNMRLEKCYVCSSTVYPGHGSMLVRNDATCIRFCRSKCRKNFNMRRNPRYLKWTKAGRRASGKEMVIDSTFDFQRRRNRVVKYDRELMSTTLSAMKTVQKIRVEREKSFFKQRMKVKAKLEKRQALKELERHAEIVQPAVVRERKQLREANKLKVSAQTMQD